MKNLKGFALGLTVGLALALSSIAFAQTTTPIADQKTTVEGASCCASSCCCKGDSCSMKKGETSKDATASAHSGCCCCDGDSCSKSHANQSHDKQMHEKHKQQQKTNHKKH